MKFLSKTGLMSGLALAMSLLTGCASTYSSHVTTVNQLPADFSQKTYQIDLSKEQAETPEFVQAADDVRIRLGELGFNEVKPDASPSLKIALGLNTRPSDTEIFSPYGSMRFVMTPYGTIIPVSGFMTTRLYSPYIRMPYRRFYSRWYDPFYSPFYLGRHLDPFYAPYTVRQYYTHELNLAIVESSGNKAIYQVTARAEKSDPEIEQQIPFLVESALRGFPAKTGKEWVVLKLEK